jgi:maltose phosphorylase
MKNYYKINEWKVIEEGFDPSMQKASESIFSLGNGRMGQRAFFEEKYSGASLHGIYIAGVYYPDKTRVGWWKNGYPEYFAKVPNSPNWIGIHITINGEELDLNQCEVEEFYRELNMKEGYLLRKFTAILKNGNKISVEAKRFLSMAEDNIGAIRYAVKSLNFSGKIIFTPFIDGNVKNQDANYDEIFWETEEVKAGQDYSYLVSRTRKSGFYACMTMAFEILKNNEFQAGEAELIEKPGFVANKRELDIQENEEIVLNKYVSVLNSMNHARDEITGNGSVILGEALKKKFDRLLKEHIEVWAEKWSHSDIKIEGDEAAQQGIRFNIFQLNQTYTGQDERLNIGPKGFTGEKYGGGTYWDTEAYLIPFYLSTATEEVSKNLLIYRYKHLQKAIENAQKLGFDSGAALYPMVTMNGEESHNEWEITFEEIHRNGAIAYAIYNYINYTDDWKYLADYGLEVLIAISRFWRQRVNWSDVKGKYVMLGVTGPNEYENNVNNNWYTNKLASWTLEYTLETLEYVMHEYPARYTEIVERTNFQNEVEIKAWKDIIDHMYFPYSDTFEVFLQQEGFLDKEQLKVSALSKQNLPLNQNWSWDRILRSVFIKQADVLQGIFNFEREYDLETIRKNYEFYEPRTVHESSLSPCIHAILAAKLGKEEDAYNLYLRTSRLDLDDYNHEVDEGLHITSMGGTWMSVVYGFGGLRVRENMLNFNPLVPKNWESLSFRIMFRNNVLRIRISGEGFEMHNEKGPDLHFILGEEEYVCREKDEFRTELAVKTVNGK